MTSARLAARPPSEPLVARFLHTFVVRFEVLEIAFVPYRVVQEIKYLGVAARKYLFMGTARTAGTRNFESG
jgi:hypothetical protein